MRSEVRPVAGQVPTPPSDSAISIVEPTETRVIREGEVIAGEVMQGEVIEGQIVEGPFIEGEYIDGQIMMAREPRTQHILSKTAMAEVPWR